MNTTGRVGKLTKSATVHTNDKKHPRLKLTISTHVEKFANITPKRVRLNGLVGDQISSSVTIVPKKKYPFRIVEAKASRGENISIKLEEKKQEKGDEYLLAIQNMKKEKGRYFDTVLLKTDSKVKPEIKISVYGNISDPKPKKKPSDTKDKTMK
ncbi:Uncharacterized protein dnm_026780 [Desulfonema magnum]|uniref:DUF1573 domain-containing protein n=1 Tax=Desulfonema magnum TaxID=45655 RepID=A0A975GMG2_9BACT|nr:Uncharacterized protein dnm_026780 [Desulfonema magnum]